MIRVTVWNENVSEQVIPEMKDIYPEGMHGCIAAFLGKEEDIEVRTATLDQDECGLPDEVLDNTDVMLWWSHGNADKVPDELARKVANRVLCGMGIIFLHSAHFAKPFKLLMGTSCCLRWREGDFERVWTVNPGHPIAKGIPPYFELEREEMYGEFFDIPQPDELVFTGWFRGGEVFRSGCCWHRGLGKVFYFQPGHETNPTYHNPYVQRVILNAVRWAEPTCSRKELNAPWQKKSAEDMHRDGETLPEY